MLDNDQFEELELLLHQRRYRYKGTARRLMSYKITSKDVQEKGDYENSLKCFNENLTRGRSKDLPFTEGVALVNLGKTYFQMEDYAEVKKFAHRAHGFHRIRPSKRYYRVANSLC